VLAVSGPVDSEPPGGPFAPDQPPEAVQEVAFVENQVSIEDPPLTTEVGFAVSDTVGNTLTVADALALPPGPMQAREKLAPAVRGPVDAGPPEGALVPDQPPEAVQKVASVEDHVSIADAPLATTVGFAASDTVGTGGSAAPPELAAVGSTVPPPQAANVRPSKIASRDVLVRNIGIPTLCTTGFGQVAPRRERTAIRTGRISSSVGGPSYSSRQSEASSFPNEAGFLPSRGACC